MLQLQILVELFEYWKSNNCGRLLRLPQTHWHSASATCVLRLNAAAIVPLIVSLRACCYPWASAVNVADEVDLIKKTSELAVH
jgi:uncharacterized protein involved in tolerance to divalent cations